MLASHTSAADTFVRAWVDGRRLGPGEFPAAPRTPEEVYETQASTTPSTDNHHDSSVPTNHTIDTTKDGNTSDNNQNPNPNLTPMSAGATNGAAAPDSEKKVHQTQPQPTTSSSTAIPSSPADPPTTLPLFGPHEVGRPGTAPKQPDVHAEPSPTSTVLPLPLQL